MKNTDVKIFAQAYGYSYAITIILFFFRKPLIFLYQDLLDKKLTYQFSEIFIISKTEVVMASLSPLALPITSLLMSRWLPKYFILAIIYFLCLLGIYKASELIIKNKLLIVSILLLIFNLIGIYISTSLATSI
ncbi:hypothetical protein [Psychrobacter celer]|uniref:hypothetical protein n=1 Tax=Psychrobacter celer TaxID=306572 RepID=UPI0025975A75|nr:hypothetical protein [uncultured Psychrobacter sp.]